MCSHVSSNIFLIYPTFYSSKWKLCIDDAAYAIFVKEELNFSIFHNHVLSPFCQEIEVFCLFLIYEKDFQTSLFTILVDIKIIRNSKFKLQKIISNFKYAK